MGTGSVLVRSHMLRMNQAVMSFTLLDKIPMRGHASLHHGTLCRLAGNAGIDRRIDHSSRHTLSSLSSGVSGRELAEPDAHGALQHQVPSPCPPLRTSSAPAPRIHCAPQRSGAQRTHSTWCQRCTGHTGPAQSAVYWATRHPACSGSMASARSYLHALTCTLVHVDNPAVCAAVLCTGCQSHCWHELLATQLSDTAFRTPSAPVPHTQAQCHGLTPIPWPVPQLLPRPRSAHLVHIAAVRRQHQVQRAAGQRGHHLRVALSAPLQLLGPARATAAAGPAARQGMQVTCHLTASRQHLTSRGQSP